MLFFALSCNYALRVNLSVAIVAMVNYTTSSPDNTSTSDQCPYPEDKVTADDHNGSKETVPLPIKEIAKSKAFWAIAASNVGETWGLYTLLNETPKYFDSILHIKIKNNGLYTAAPYLGGLIFANVFGFLSDILLKKKILTHVQVRRWAMTTAHYGPILCLIGMCFVNCNSAAAIIILFIAITLNGAVYCGYMCSHIDISPRFSAPLMGITNTLGTIPGFVTPVVVGAIINDNNTNSCLEESCLLLAIVNTAEEKSKTERPKTSSL
ncbi:putative inorganic phosphate cotransporter [Armadillidium vulgare]|nr:putative inorganic phosphate cotransporter [Armadillidium vulgare]